ncbi:MAG TPA: efflux transporter outer membrane subunit [Castellaniella sp.]|uniref:efflux transporter outer membrane subunit n=1 Tax=Castellaniella sp. TaxID=1955812 RepID=UPI002F14F5D5
MKPKIRRAPLALLFLFVLVLGGCAVGPDYQRPQVAVPAHYKELPGWARAEPAAAAPKGPWWVVFQDPLLNQLEPQVAVSNQTVAQNYANYQAALAEIKVARSALFPTLGVSGSTSRQRSSGALSTSAQNSGSLEGSVSWAPDLWGGVRRSIEANKANAQASQATLANATLSEQLALAEAVIELRVTDANIDLLQKTVEAYRESLRVVSNQDKAGTVPPSDVISARAQLENAQSNLIALGVARAQYAHAIAVLVGKNPEALSLPHDATLPPLPQVPVGVPSTLLQRRPDIAIAERQMAAQNADIGVAEAAYYPNLSLSAVDGFMQSPLAGLLNIANHVWSLGADVGLTLFDGGERHGQVLAAKARYEAAVANYRGTVLAAFKNVEDDLSGLRIREQQAVVLDGAVRDATRATEIARNEYAAGTVDFTAVSVAQATQLNNEQTALNVREQRLLGAVSLIGDLGGGWSASDMTLASDAPPAR